MDDRQAVEKTLAGDGDAFAVLVSRYQAKVYVVALSRVYDPQDAEDLCQETFLRAYTKLPMLRDHDAFAPWLFSILRRLCVDFMRGTWQMKQQEQRMESARGQTGTSADPRDTVCARETAETLWSLVRKLDERSREVLTLHYGQQMKVREIAELTGTKESTVKMRLTRARNVLGERADLLRAAAPAPALSAKVMQGVKAIGPLKGGVVAASGLLGILAAWVTLFGWLPRKDVDRWQGHVPDRMIRQGRRTFAQSMLFSLIVFLGLPLLHRRFKSFFAQAPVRVVCVIVAAALWYAVIKREIQLTSPWDKVKQLMNLACLLLLFAVVALVPDHFGIGIGVFMILQFFFVNHAAVAGGAVLPGFWVGPLLKDVDVSEVEPKPVEKKRLKRWLIWLHEHGLVAPPCKTDSDAITVRLRLRNYFGEKMAWRQHSTLRVNAEGEVSCAVTPRDYVAVAENLGAQRLPGRRELSARLGVAFTKALGVYANGGPEANIVDSLGLAQCPLDVKKTYLFRVNRYLMPLAGVLVLTVFLLKRLI